MSDQLTLEIPESVTSHFVVATGLSTSLSPGDIRDLLGDAARRGAEAASLARTACELLDSPLVLVAGKRAGDSDWTARLDGVAGAEEEVRRLRWAEHHLVLTSVAPPAAQPRHAQAVRFMARVLAEHTGGLVADLAAGQTLSAGEVPAGETERFVLADDWTAAFVGSDDEPEARVPEQEVRIRIDTTGLARFGVPDLVARHVPGDRMITSINLLRALAYRLLAGHWDWLADHPGHRARTIDVEQHVDIRDLWRFWGARPVGDGGLWVRLAWGRPECPDCPDVLEVAPPEGRDPGDWWDGVPEVIPSLARVLEDPKPRRS
ncbi:MAG: hypothetical protein JWN52_1412 [Actinomycetia bacterium]|nr:hypothetical protein [Actinomycetes bacterium]